MVQLIGGNSNPDTCQGINYLKGKSFEKQYKYLFAGNNNQNSQFQWGKFTQDTCTFKLNTLNR